MPKDYAIVDNVSDAKQIKTAKTHQKFNDKRAAMDIQAIMELDFGRRFIWKLIADNGIYHDIYSQDHSWMSYEQGRKVTATMLNAQIENANLDLFRKMQDENKPKEGDS